MTIQESALLIKIKCTKWQHSKNDKDAATALAIQHNVFDKDGNPDHKAFSVHQNMADVPVIKALDKTIGRVGNNVVRKMLLPWTEGEHLVTADILDKVERKLEEYQDHLIDLERELKQEWPTKLKELESRLGDKFDPDFYPSVDDIADAYSITFKLKNIDDSNDIRVKLPNSKIKKIKEDAEEEITRKVKVAQDKVRDRVVGVLETMIEGLERHGVIEEGATKPSKFANSTIANVKELADILPDLNIFGDDQLDIAANKILSKLRNANPDELRESEDKRKETIKDAKNIVDSLSGFYD